MNVATDCRNCGITYSCGDCKEGCKQNLPCRDFSPTDEFCVGVFNFLKKNASASRGRTLRRYTKKNGCGIVADSDTLDNYYVGLVNDALRQLRHGETVYVFSFEQIKDVLRFESNIDITKYDDCCYQLKQIT